MSEQISRELLGKIVDEVFDGGLEDASVVEDIYRVIKREEAPAVEICDAVLAWIVSNDLGDSDREYHPSEVIEILDGLLSDPVEPSTPVGHIIAMMAEKGLKPADLHHIFGSKSRTSEILNCKRPLQVKHIRALVTEFGMSAYDLIAEYSTLPTGDQSS